MPTTEETLPANSAVARTLAEIDELFREQGDATVVTVLFRGDAFTPGGLAQMDAFITKVISDPAIGGLLAPEDPLVAPSLLVKAVLGTDDLASLSQPEIEAARGPPQIQAALSALTGTTNDGTPVTIALIRLRDSGDERTPDAERKIHEIAAAGEGPLRISSISSTVVEDEYTRALEEETTPLVGVAFAVIAVLILLFMRTFSDLLLTLFGLLISIVWIIGAEGWLGPNGAGLTGPPNQLTSLVPIIILGLTVDYAIQIVSHYRESRLAGENVIGAVRVGLRQVTVPLVLAAGTTAAAMLVGLFSPIQVVGDFGIIAALGVAGSLLVMLTLVPAGRVIIDRRREARDKLKPARPIANAVPGVGRAAEALGRSLARRPAPYILAVLAITAGLGFAVPTIKSEFSLRDILPKGGEIHSDLTTLGEALGGSPQLTTVLLKAEASEIRTLLNLQDLAEDFTDETRRPRAAAGPIEASYEMLLRDWIHDSGEPGDKFDAEIATLFEQASAGVRGDSTLMQTVLDKLEEKDPAVRRLLVNNPSGSDGILLQFRAFSGDYERTRTIQAELEELWGGDDSALTATSIDIVGLTVTDAITERQTEAVITTVAAAFLILAIFFWVTARQPGLAIVAVAPIVLVLIAVLGTMALLDIPYSLITSIVTALSIGIGVDYTIHMIHRYREEYEVLRKPDAAATRTLATTGSALLGSALTTALGLGVLVFSPLTASQDFAITAALTIAYSLIASVLLVPPAMTVWGAYQNMRLRSRVQRLWDDLDEEMEAIHQRHQREQQAQETPPEK